MRRTERVLVYGALAGLILLGLAGRSGIGTAAAGLRAEPPVAKVATCDIYAVADKLINSDKYKPDLEAEKKKVEVTLAPLAEEIQELERRLRGMKPEDAGAQEIVEDYQRKTQSYSRLAGELQQKFQAYVADKYVDAYEQVRASCDAVAQDLGYTHVLASRKRDEKIKSEDIQRVIEAVLARPVITAPEGSDITEDVVKDLKLD